MRLRNCKFVTLHLGNTRTDRVTLQTTGFSAMPPRVPKKAGGPIRSISVRIGLCGLGIRIDEAKMKVLADARVQLQQQDVVVWRVRHEPSWHVADLLHHLRSRVAWLKQLFGTESAVAAALWACAGLRTSPSGRRCSREFVDRTGCLCGQRCGTAGSCSCTAILFGVCATPCHVCPWQKSSDGHNSGSTA